MTSMVHEGVLGVRVPAASDSDVPWKLKRGTRKSLQKTDEVESGGSDADEGQAERKYNELAADTAVSKKLQREQKGAETGSDTDSDEGEATHTDDDSGNKRNKKRKGTKKKPNPNKKPKKKVGCRKGSGRAVGVGVAGKPAVASAFSKPQTPQSAAHSQSATDAQGAAVSQSAADAQAAADARGASGRPKLDLLKDVPPLVVEFVGAGPESTFFGEHTAVQMMRRLARWIAMASSKANVGTEDSKTQYEFARKELQCVESYVKTEASYMAKMTADARAAALAFINAMDEIKAFQQWAPCTDVWCEFLERQYLEFHAEYCIADDGALNKLTTSNLNKALHSRVQDGDQHWLIMQGLTGCLSRSMAVSDIQACWLDVHAQMLRTPATEFDSRVGDEMRDLAVLMRTPLPLDMSAEALADVETARANAQQGTNTFANQLPRHSRGREILQNIDNAKANLKVALALQKDIEGLQDRAEKLSLPDDSPVALRTSLHQWFQDLDALRSKVRSCGYDLPIDSAVAKVKPLLEKFLASVGDLWASFMISRLGGTTQHVEYVDSMSISMQALCDFNNSLSHFKVGQVDRIDALTACSKMFQDNWQKLQAILDGKANDLSDEDIKMLHKLQVRIPEAVVPVDKIERILELWQTAFLDPTLARLQGLTKGPLHKFVEAYKVLRDVPVDEVGADGPDGPKPLEDQLAITFEEPARFLIETADPKQTRCKVDGMVRAMRCWQNRVGIVIMYCRVENIEVLQDRTMLEKLMEQRKHVTSFQAFVEAQTIAGALASLGALPMPGLEEAVDFDKLLREMLAFQSRSETKIFSAWKRVMAGGLASLSALCPSAAELKNKKLLHDKEIQDIVYENADKAHIVPMVKSVTLAKDVLADAECATSQVLIENKSEVATALRHAKLAVVTDFLIAQMRERPQKVDEMPAWANLVMEKVRAKKVAIPDFWASGLKQLPPLSAVAPTPVKLEEKALPAADCVAEDID